MSRSVQSLLSKLSGRLDPTILSLRQKDFFSKIAKLSNSQNSDDDNDERDSPPASPPPIARARQGRRGSLPTMHLGSGNKAIHCRPNASLGTDTGNRKKRVTKF